MADATAADACDVAVVGAGPAGIAAAVTAAELGRRVILVDDNPAPGGQIWRAGVAGVGPPTPGRGGPNPGGSRADHGHPGQERWLGRLEGAGVGRLSGAAVVGRLDGRTLLVETGDGPRAVAWDRLILAAGARERLLPFPGWTLPGVFGAGGLQSLARGGWPGAGARVVIAGSGPLLLAVGEGLGTAGAEVVGIYEQAPAGRLAGFALTLARHPGKVGQGLRLRWALRGVPYRIGWWPERAEGDGRLERVVVTDGRRSRTIACDALACGFGLVPSVELARLYGCEIDPDRGAVRVDVHQRTSVDGVFAAGELTGVGGADKALIEGRIAALAACDRAEAARRLVRPRDGWLAFARALDRAFALRPELKQLADDGTIVCRCEDVPLGRVRAYDSWRAAKLQTRCGMGPCQGRVCGAALREILGWDLAADSSPRPPVLASRVSSLMLPTSLIEPVSSPEPE